MFDKITTGRWWDKAWSLVEGCTPCSPGCRHCWALAMEKRFHGELPVKFRCDRLMIPVKRKKPTAWAVWNDLFHPAVTKGDIDATLDIIGSCPQHTFLVLTKRADRIEEMIYGVDAENGCRELGGGDYLPNMWLGVTVCNQQEADEKIPHLLKVPAAVRFLSVEPMLGPIDLSIAAFNGADSIEGLEGINWVICGGETGPGARPMNMGWVLALRDQCVAAGVPFYLKGGTAQYAKDRLLEGVAWNQMPAIKGLTQ